MNEGLASASVTVAVEKEAGEIKAINDRTKAGFIEYGGKNHWSVTHTLEPGRYTMTGKNPGCPIVVQSAAFEEGKAYNIVLTEDCKIKSVTY
jgi:hypothetical protein